MRGAAWILPGVAALALASGSFGSGGPSPHSTANAPLSIFVGTSKGFFWSRDWGNSWQVLKATPEGTGPIRSVMAVLPYVWAGGDRGLFFSADSGLTWKQLYDKGAVLSVVASRNPVADPTVYMGTPTGLLRSQDMGKTFEPTSLSGTSIQRIEWPGPDILVASDSGVMVFREGNDRFEVSQGLPGGRVASLALSTSFFVDPVGFAGLVGSGVFRSSDGARTWTAAGLKGHTVSDMVWFGQALYAATEAGFFESEDLGLTWEGRSEGIETRNVTRILFPYFPVSGGEAFIGTDAGVFWTGDAGLHWQPTGLKDETILALATFPPPPLAVSKK